jgi:hypothetical protein
VLWSEVSGNGRGAGNHGPGCALFVPESAVTVFHANEAFLEERSQEYAARRLGISIQEYRRRRAALREQIAAAERNGNLIDVDGDDNVGPGLGGATPRRRRRRVARRIMRAGDGRMPPQRPSSNWAANDELWNILTQTRVVDGQ